MGHLSPEPLSQKLLPQVSRILQSSVFSGSESLRLLLNFLAEQAASHPGQPVKEKEIAAAVFGRAGDFDPQNDSTVRVHTGRLRSKLAEYYMGEGAADRLVVEIPRGSYQLACHPREVVTEPPSVASENPQPVASAQRNLLFFMILGGLCIAGSAFLIGRYSAPSPGEASGPSLTRFWAGLHSVGQKPLLIFGNPRFVGSDFNGMRYWRDSDDPREAVVDTFTSVGDVAGVFEVTRQLGVFGVQPLLKRAQLLTWDDAKDRNLIVVGSPISIRTLREHPFLEEFVFKDRTEEPRVGVGAILNKHPVSGEESIYFGPETRPYQFDYAVIARVPGVNPARSALVLAGITSHGTQAAAEFVSREDTVAQLLSRVDSAPGVRSFECLLRVRVSGGVPVHPEILALRVRP